MMCYLSGWNFGKFMEKKKHKNPVTQQYYEEKDFLIGKTLFLGGYKFSLVKADEYTEKYMEDMDNNGKDDEKNVYEFLD